MKNIYQPPYQKILFFCILLLSCQLTFAQTLPDPTGLPSDQIVCYDETVSLTGSCASGSLKWYDGLLSTAEITDLTPNITSTTTYYAVCVSSCTCEMSNSIPVTFTVNTPSAITRSQIICDGSSIELKASCPRGVVSWYQGDTDTPLGGTSTVVTPTSETTYYVRCEDAVNSCDSPFSDVTIGVGSPGSQNTIPTTSDETVCTGSTFTLTANCATGATPYFFENNGYTEVPSGVIRPTSGPITYKVRCEDGVNCSSDFVPIVITTSDLPKPTINTDPDLAVCRGSAVLLDATCNSGSTPVWYYSNGTTLVPTPLTQIATTTYKVRCENDLIPDCVSAFDSTTVTSIYEITAHPQSVLVCLGDNATFTVSSTGGATFQWQKKQPDGTFADIVSATDSTLILSNTTIADRGYYRCLVAGFMCDTYSEEAYLVFPQTVVAKNKLTPTSIGVADEFGVTVAISGNYAIVGSPAKTVNIAGDAKGAAFIYKMNPDGTWAQMALLAPTDLQYGDYFGTSVAITGDFAFVSAPDQNSEAGSVYVFKRQPNNTWLKVDKLTDSPSVSHDFFGQSIAVTDNYLAISQPANDKIFFYRNNAGSWVADGSIVEGSSGYGGPIAISGNTFVLGTPDSGINGGAVVYERDNGGTWQRMGDIVPDSLDVGSIFGFSVAVSGNTILGTVLDVLAQEARVYVFEKNGEDNWLEKGKLATDDLSNESLFGFTIAIQGNIAVVGAPLYDDSRGAAVVFEKNAAGNWVQKELIIPSGLVEDDGFGSTMAVGQNAFIVCSSFFSGPLFPSSPSNKGAAHFFSLNIPPALTAGGVSQAVGVCTGQTATFNLTGLPVSDTFTITYKIDAAGTEKTVDVTSDATGKASFTQALTTADNTKTIYITKIKNNTTSCEKVLDVSSLVTIKAPTVITGSPSATTVCVGETAVFTGEATGEGILNFQWQRQAPSVNGVNGPITNDFSDLSVLTLQNRTLADNGALYRVKVTGECGVATSGDAKLTVLGKATAQISAGAPVCPGSSAILVINGTPGAEVHYTSNGFATSVMLDASGVATIVTNPISVNTTYNLVSINIEGKCNKSISGTAIIEVLPTGASIPPALVLTSPTNDVLNTITQNNMAKTIQSTNKINTGGKSEQRGVKYVLLEAGFEASQGSVFLAKVEAACP